MPDLVEQGLATYRARKWQAALEALTAADRDGALDGDGLDRLAEVAYLVGRDDVVARARERAHGEHLRTGAHDRAAQSAFWLALSLLLQGDAAPAAGWLARAATILDDASVDGPARGYLLVADALQTLAAGDAERAEALSAEAAHVGDRFGDRDVWALGWLGRGEAAVARGELVRGMTFLDEVMVSVLAGELSPIPTGIVYCATIEACVRSHDVARASQWTAALSRWCDDEPEVVPFRGQCLIHRAQVFQAKGDWDRAASEATGAHELLSHPPHPARGVAAYLLGELHRLRGSYRAAESAYLEATELGVPPDPGHALLRLAQGRVDAAVGGIRRALDETTEDARRPALLAAAVEILIAADDVAAASAAADELEHLAGVGAPPVLRALASHARGATALASGDPRSALPLLRRACTSWQQVDMPYEAARTRVLVAAACRALGDADGADAELASARRVFARLGAAPDLERVATRARRERAPDPSLSARECDVLRLVASGCTNKEVGAALRISEHTVARHLQNIFTKLGVSTRAAAVATAIERSLV